MKGFTDSSATSTESFGDLRKELARHKESEASTSVYIQELEARLARSDADTATLRGSIERLEDTLAKRDEDMRNLEARLEAFLQEKADVDNWKVTLEEREKRVEELEKQLEEWEKVRRQAGDERERLNGAVSEVEEARRSLEMEVTKQENGATDSDTDVDNFQLDDAPSSRADPSSAPTNSVREQMRALQRTHSTTLKELASVTSKYQDALLEISDLSSQISEAKSQSPDGSDVDVLKSPKTPSRRRPSAPIFTNAVNGTGGGKRPYFRHAASADSLHSRYGRRVSQCGKSETDFFFFLIDRYRSPFRRNFHPPSRSNNRGRRRGSLGQNPPVAQIVFSAQS